MHILGIILATVPIQTANFLAYVMAMLISLFLVAGPLIIYYFMRKNKRVKTVSPTESV